jgi:putative DNA primase/helicase
MAKVFPIRRPGAPIDVTHINLDPATDEAISVLVRWNSPPTLFLKNGVIVRMGNDKEGHPIIVAAGVSIVRNALAKASEFTQRRKVDREWKEVFVPPPLVLVENVIATQYLPLPTLRGITLAPYFTAEGKLVTKPGYNPDSGLFLVLDGVSVPEVPSKPTDERIAAAVALIDDLLIDFPIGGKTAKSIALGDPNPDRANAFATLLLSFAREMIPGATPLHLVEAGMCETGKTLLCKVLLMPGCGDVSEGALGRDDSERRKKIMSILQHGRPAVLLDNLKGLVDSPDLEAVITSFPTYSDRMLGGNDSPEFVNRLTWVATSNNATMSPDLVSRSILTRLDAEMENPSDREEWKHPNVLEFARQNRGQLVAAAMTIVQGWISNGSKTLAKPPKSRFTAWASVMGSILAHAKVYGLAGNAQELRESADTGSEALQTFVAEWSTHLGEENVTASQLLPHAVTAGVKLGKGESDASKVSVLGIFLRSKRHHVIGKHKIVRRGRSGWGLDPVTAPAPGPTGDVGLQGCVGSTSTVSANGNPSYVIATDNPTSPYNPTRSSECEFHTGRADEPCHSCGVVLREHPF